MRALLVGQAPPVGLGYTYVSEPPYEAVVIGSLSVGKLLHFDIESALEALAEGKSVVLYTPGLPRCPHNRALGASLTARQRELKSWGVVFTDGAQKRLITAQEARAMRAAGTLPAPGAVLTPLAKEILEGSQ
ncbi:MAG: hypothetical protein J6A74_03430 [Oscillospiraceae bacterium]|nr:hypothetical protein [Oscillospiraceae bacterium]